MHGGVVRGGVVLMLLTSCAGFRIRDVCASSVHQITNVKNTTIAGDLSIVQSAERTPFYACEAGPAQRQFPVVYLTPMGPAFTYANVSHLRGFGIERNQADCTKAALDACEARVEAFLLETGLQMTSPSILKCVVRENVVCAG